MLKKFFIYTLITLLLGQAMGEEIAYRDNHLENNALSARGQAMSGAVSAVLDSSDSILFNPAAMFDNSKYSIYMKNDNSFVDVQRLSVASIIPLAPRHILGVGYTSIGVNNINIAYDTGTSIEVLDTVSYGEKGSFIAYAYKVTNKFSIGATYKEYTNKLDIDEEIYAYGEASGVDYDFGMIYKATPTLVMAVGFKNIASQTNPEGILRWKNDYRESFDFGPYLGFSKKLWHDSLLLAADARNSKLYGTYTNIGLEYWLSESLALRAGESKLRGGAFGLGLKLGDFVVDYAYMPEFGTEADNRHIVSAGISFDSAFAKPKKDNTKTYTYEELEEQELEPYEEKETEVIFQYNKAN